VADLVRRLPLDMVIRVCGMSSYRGATTEGAELRWTLAPPDDLAGRQVLIVDDILDSGRTIGLVRSAVDQQDPSSVRACVLLARRSSRHQADFVGFQIGQEYVVGYGLDYDGRFRNLPEIAAIDR
jgi:hypoxanthine phosphoribosyltransferase